MAYNHYPVIGRKVPVSCGSFGDTADPFAPITCPSCRARLQTKVDAHTETARTYPLGSQEANFFAKDAAAWSRVLAA